MSQLRSVFQSFGYQALETPSIERQEMLLGKLGDEAQKLLYLFEDNGGRKVGLRYDLTVPLARFVAGNLNELPLPYKRFEIGNSWRAERAQKGRLRQFTQADVDIIGDNNSLASEKELLSVIRAVQEKLGIDWLCLLNDRRVIKEILTNLKVPAENQGKLLVALDKKDKLTETELEEELKRVGLSDVQLRQISAVFLIDQGHLDRAKAVLDDPSVLSRMEELLSYAKSIGLKADFAPFMVRGLEYYTGTIVECVTADYPSSLVGGGRYDSLIEDLTGQKVPSIGVSFGVDRLADYLADKELSSRPLFMTNLPETTGEVALWLKELRAKGKNIEQYLDSTVELGKQIKYADKRGFASILIPTEEAWKKGEIIEKNLASGDQVSRKRSEI